MISWLGSLIILIMFLGVVSIVFNNTAQSINKTTKGISDKIKPLEFDYNPYRYFLIISDTFYPYAIDESPMPYAKVSYLLAHDSLGLWESDRLIPKEYRGNLLALIRYGIVGTKPVVDSYCCRVDSSKGTILLEANQPYCYRIGGKILRWRHCIDYINSLPSIDELVIVLDSLFPIQKDNIYYYTPSGYIVDGSPTMKLLTVNYYVCYFYSRPSNVQIDTEVRKIITVYRASSDSAKGYCYYLKTNQNIIK